MILFIFVFCVLVSLLFFGGRVYGFGRCYLVRLETVHVECFTNHVLGLFGARQLAILNFGHPSAARSPFARSLARSRASLSLARPSLARPLNLSLARPSLARSPLARSLVSRGRGERDAAAAGG